MSQFNAENYQIPLAFSVSRWYY